MNFIEGCQADVTVTELNALIVTDSHVRFVVGLPLTLTRFRVHVYKITRLVHLYSAAAAAASAAIDCCVASLCWSSTANLGAFFFTHQIDPRPTRFWTGTE